MAVLSQIKSLFKTDKPIEDKGTVSGNILLDLTRFSSISVTSGGDISIDLTGTYAVGKVYVTELLIINGGANAVSWAPKFQFIGGTVPLLTVNGTDSFVLITRDGGVTCSVFPCAQDVKAV